MWNLSPAALKTRRSGKLILLTGGEERKNGETTIKLLLYKIFQQQVIQHSLFHTFQYFLMQV